MGKQWQTIFWGSKITADGDWSYEIKRGLFLGRKVMTNIDSILKSRDMTANKRPSSQSYGFSSRHVWMWELNYTESWALRIDAFELCRRRLLRVPWTTRRFQPVYPKGSQPWIFIGRTDAEAETPILWPLDSKSWLIWKDPDAGNDWKQEEKGTAKDEMIGWHHWPSGYGFK